MVEKKCAGTKVSVMSLDEFAANVAAGLPKKNILGRLFDWVVA